jgi:hypothetical protein
MVPAVRAALMATLSMGWSVDDMGCEPLRGHKVARVTVEEQTAMPQAIWGGDNVGFYRFNTTPQQKPTQPSTHRRTGSAGLQVWP